MLDQYGVGINEYDWADIPAGEFMMGSPESEEERNDDEQLHRVDVSAFKMLKTPVTFAMFDLFCESTGRDKPDDEGWGRISRPVIYVSCLDAMAYCRWLEKKTGWSVRLPTEAEWEYACRAGTSTMFWPGDSITSEQANFDGIYFYGSKFKKRPRKKGLSRCKTTPVKTFQANPWGLYDMHGNIWEYCALEDDENYSGQKLGKARGNNIDNRYYVLRGGSWSGEPWDMRSAMRYLTFFNFSGSDFGFRLACSEVRER